jgi:tetratricopeptide (TPR) repeat protein
MRPELSTRFDIVMSRLKAMEPGPAFDLEFRRRLTAAAARGYLPGILERAAGSLAETAGALARALMPDIPVAAKMTLVSVIAVSLGVSIYLAQPAIPALTGREGAIATQGPIKPGSVITIGEGSQADMELYGRYAMRLKDKTKIRVVSLTPRHGSGRVTFELIEGTVFVDIKEGFRGSEFLIKTNSGAAMALGTKFSMDASEDRTRVSVLEGKVKVENGPKSVMVKAGQKTQVSRGQAPLSPQRLVEKDWLDLEELYQIGRSPRVVLLLKNTPDRVRQLLRPCPIYITGEAPRELPALLEKALMKIEEAIKKGDRPAHLEAIRMLEEIAAKHPNPNYNAQLLMYIGAYYEYVGNHQRAIKTFEKVAADYPGSVFASLALTAVGVIYEEQLSMLDKASNVFKFVLDRYPYTLEAIWIEDKLGIKKAG